MKLLRNEEIKIPEWKNALSKSSFVSPFQSPEFFQLYNSTQGYSSDVFAVELNNELQCLAVVTIQKEKGVKSYFSRRGIIYGGPLILKNDIITVQFLLQGISKHYKDKLIYLEIRNNYDFSFFNDGFNEADFVYQKHLNVQLNVKDLSIDEILKGMKYNRRREINLSFKEGALVREAKSVKDIEETYKILSDLYKSRVKLPLPEIEFFINLFNSPIGKVFVVSHNEMIIGGTYCIFDDQSIYTLYYSGIRDYNKKIFPTHLAIIGAITYAIDNKLSVVDFMGAGKPEEEYGVRDFKLQFGGDLVEHGRYINILNPLLYKTGKLGLKMLAKIK